MFVCLILAVETKMLHPLEEYVFIYADLISVSPRSLVPFERTTLTLVLSSFKCTFLLIFR